MIFGVAENEQTQGKAGHLVSRPDEVPRVSGSLPVRQGRRSTVLVESLEVQTCRFLGHPSFQDLPELGSLYLDLPTVLDVSLFIQKTEPLRISLWGTRPYCLHHCA